MKEFEIEELAEDEYSVNSLVNDSKLTFKKNVELARKLSNINADARMNMIRYMKENGIKKEDLIDKVVKNGKIYYDETNYRMLEQGFITDAAQDIAMNIFDHLFGMSAEKVISTLGISNSEEAKARNARMIALTNSRSEKLDDLFENIIRVPDVQELFSPLVAIVPLQLLAYYIAEFLGKDVDQPRNLAKSVTVE